MKKSILGIVCATAIASTSAPALSAEKVAIGVPSWTGAQAIAHGCHLLGINIADTELCAGAGQLFGQMFPHAAKSLNGHMHTLELLAVELKAHGGFDAGQDAACGIGGGVAAGGGAGDKTGVLGDNIHIF